MIKGWSHGLVLGVIFLILTGCWSNVERGASPIDSQKDGSSKIEANPFKAMNSKPVESILVLEGSYASNKKLSEIKSTEQINKLMVAINEVDFISGAIHHMEANCRFELNYKDGSTVTFGYWNANRGSMLVLDETPYQLNKESVKQIDELLISAGVQVSAE